MDVLPTGTHFDETDVCPVNKANADTQSSDD
jgi:hypothetical protein